VQSNPFAADQHSLAELTRAALQRDSARAISLLLERALQNACQAFWPHSVMV